MNSVELALICFFGLIGYLLVGSAVVGLWGAHIYSRGRNRVGGETCCEAAKRDGNLGSHLLVDRHYLGWWLIFWPVHILFLPAGLIVGFFMGLYKAGEILSTKVVTLMVGEGKSK